MLGPALRELDQLFRTLPGVRNQALSLLEVLELEVGALHGGHAQGAPAFLPIWADEQQRTSVARSARDQLEQQMEWDRAELERHVGTAWHGAAELAEEGGDERSPAAQRTGGA